MDVQSLKSCQGRGPIGIWKYVGKKFGIHMRSGGSIDVLVVGV
jgi:hypothetical protein